MTVLEIIVEYLKEHGYDGLYSDNCGCELDDLMPCGSCAENCKAGYRIEGCTCGEGCAFHIVKEKQ